MGAIAHRHPDFYVKGAILTLDLANGEVAFFNGYEPQETIFNGLIERAGSIWSDYQAMLRGNDVVRRDVELEFKTEVSPLCGFCNHLTSCPRFEAEEVPQLANSVETLQKLQANEKAMQEEIKKLKRNLLAVVEQKGPIKSGGCLLKKATRSRKHLDTNRLEAFLAESGTAIAEYQENRSFSFLEIRKDKKAKAA